MKYAKWLVLAATFWLGAAGVGYADSISGRITDIDSSNRTIALAGEADEKGSAHQYRLVWDADSPDAAVLSGLQVNQFLSVDATRNPMTPNWKVNRVKPFAAADDAIRTDQRTIKGTVQSIDLAGNSLVLASTEADAAGNRTAYNVVWDDTNANVNDRLNRAQVGDKLSLKADRNNMTGNWKVNAIVGPARDLTHRDVKTVKGEVVSIDLAKNSLMLRVTDASGKTSDRKIVWDRDFRDQARLERLHIGDKLSVRADQNPLTRNWKVQALGA